MNHRSQLYMYLYACIYCGCCVVQWFLPLVDNWSFCARVCVSMCCVWCDDMYCVLSSLCCTNIRHHVVVFCMLYRPPASAYSVCGGVTSCAVQIKSSLLNTLWVARPFSAIYHSIHVDHCRLGSVQRSEGGGEGGRQNAGGTLWYQDVFNMFLANFKLFAYITVFLNAVLNIRSEGGGMRSKLDKKIRKGVAFAR